jgi:hypothetical protein
VAPHRLRRKSPIHATSVAPAGLIGEVDGAGWSIGLI